MTYRSQADLGGSAVDAPIVQEPEGELFHEAWEPRALALVLAMGATGAWNLDMSRAARETLPGYADLGYYGIWIRALEKLIVERDLAGADEIDQGRLLRPAIALPRRLEAVAVAQTLARGSPTSRPESRAARFAIGQPVRTLAKPFPHHTRLPGYTRGRRGLIERVHGMHVFADSNAQGLGEDPQWLYTVVFEGRELWPDADPGLRVSFDAWEPYLEPA